MSSTSSAPKPFGTPFFRMATGSLAALEHTVLCRFTKANRDRLESAPDLLGWDVCLPRRAKGLLPPHADSQSSRNSPSLPLFEQLTARTPYAEQELLNTLAHEMIHQWQFDVLKRRPDHGLDFLRKMAQMNRTGTVAVTTYHTLEKEVMALAKFAWRCQDCGRLYRRHRRTIQPKRHHCGSCRGALQELVSPTQLIEDRPTPYLTRALDSSIRSTRPAGLGQTPEQLTLELT